MIIFTMQGDYFDCNKKMKGDEWDHCIHPVVIGGFTEWDKNGIVNGIINNGKEEKVKKN